ncbi:MAG: hypothetical protein HFJ38_08130 [Bacilli bacterium]|nr:hypothetical protein [Bacilli bacterium]
MRKIKNITPKIAAMLMAVAVLCVASTMPVSAAPGDDGATTYGTITPWPSSDYITLNGTSHNCNGFPLRAGNTARVEVTVTNVSGQHSDTGLAVSLVRRYPTEATEQTTHFYGTGSHPYTFTASAGGSYYIRFSTRAECKYTFTYKVTY